MSLQERNPVSARHPKRLAIVLSDPTVSATTGWQNFAGFETAEALVREPGE